MIVIGVTGSIGMGKSTVAAMFEEAGAAVFDADAAVHDLYAPGGDAVDVIRHFSPDLIDAQGGVDRAALTRWLGEHDAFARLEAAIHPLVEKRIADFLETARAEGASFAVLDVPLLFETGMDRLVDHVVVVSAPEGVQKARVMARPGMTEAKWALVKARQTSDADKRRAADTVIETDVDFAILRKRINDLADALQNRAAGEDEDAT